tara:strand:+ start:119 stop:421 length:303 start_codon:yes stop_codon:yes gene_type:complete
MGTHNSESNCEICGGRSHLLEDTRFDSREEHCLNENCRHYNVDSGTLKYEWEDAFDGVGFDTPEGWKDMLEHIGYIKCGKCGNVGMIYDEDSPFCVDCEL